MLIYTIAYFDCRICPGRQFAEQSVYVAVTSLLATTNISKAVDNQGVEITPKLEFLDGSVRFVGSSCAFESLETA